MRTKLQVQSGGSARSSERGMATFVVLTLMAILVVLAMSNVAALRQLEREVRLVEHRQIQRLQSGTAGTNSIAETSMEATNLPAGTEAK